MNPKVLIIGGGNIGTEFACEFAAAGYEVHIFTSKPERFQTELSITDSSGQIQRKGTIAMATDNIREAMAGCLLIFVIVPAFLFAQTAQKMEPYIEEGMYIGVIPGSGGAEFAFSGCIHRGAKLFGLQRVPSIARLQEYGRQVCIEGRKKELFLASIPGGFTAYPARVMEQVFRIPCSILPNYMNVTLTPSNPILHTTRLCTLFRDYKEGVVYDHNPLFYEEWDEESAQLLLDCDDELVKMIRAMDQLDLSGVIPLRIYYESPDALSLTRKLRSIRAFKGLKSPMKKVQNGWVPDLDSRYFTADFPYGLSILIEIAHVFHVSVPHMEYTMNWYKAITGTEKTYDFASDGITCMEDVYKFYK